MNTTEVYEQKYLIGQNRAVSFPTQLALTLVTTILPQGLAQYVFL